VAPAQQGGQHRALRNPYHLTIDIGFDLHYFVVVIVDVVVSVVCETKTEQNMIPPE